jgi:hypothetical protein
VIEKSIAKGDGLRECDAYLCRHTTSQKIEESLLEPDGDEGR